MKNQLILSFILTISMTFMFSCTKPGIGGQNTVSCTPQHHGRNIKDCIIYVKFNTQNLPGTSPYDYDASFRTNPPDSFTVKVFGLQEGQYYFYCMGFDSLIMLPVSGGLPLTVSTSSGTTNLNVPITE